MKKVNIVTGHYGSGKTEFAVNYALKLKDAFGASVICDMDIVNPYFRTFDASAFLEESGVKVIASEYAGTNLDIPSLPSDIISVFSPESAPSVLDVGGDEDGAIALGQYYGYLKDIDYEMFLVVNALRPDTSKVSDILALANEICNAARCRITTVVNNTNLSYLTSPSDINDSMALVREVSEKLGAKLKYVSGTDAVLSGIDPVISEEKFPLELFMKLPFDAEGTA